VLIEGVDPLLEDADVALQQRNVILDVKVGAALTTLGSARRVSALSARSI
jgi:hypothetical protein